MKRSTLFTTPILFFILFTINFSSKAGDTSCVRIKKFIESKGEFKIFIKDNGLPLWNKALEHCFEEEKLTVIPFINYENSFINGFLFLTEKKDSMRFRFMSRKNLEKQYVSKKKKISYHHSLIATFLKFDLIMYNYIERKFTQEIGIRKENETIEIKEFKFGLELLQFVYDK